METSCRALPLIAGLVVAAGLFAPAPVQGRSQYSRAMEDITGYNSKNPVGRETFAQLPVVLPIAAIVVVGLVTLVMVFKLMSGKPGPPDPDAVAISDPWVQAQVRKRGRH
jgi:nitrate reductase NapE component